MGHSHAKCSQEEFIRIWKECGGKAEKVSEAIGVSPRNVLARRRSIEKLQGVLLKTSADIVIEHQSARITVDLPDGQAVVFSDAHYFPGEPSTAHRGLLKILKRLKPALVVCNGDAFDGATISRHPRIGWDNKPSVKSELEAVADRLNEIEKISRQAKLFWPLGNHDARYETFLAAQAPEYEGVTGFTLKDRFPAWRPCWSLMVNGNTMIKHRWHQGIHAAYNNTVKAGTSIVTGHLHSLKVTPWTDYNGDRYGVDTGTLADPYGQQFDYCEDNPRNWRAGFVVLTWVGGKLMPPEMAQVIADGKLFWRGEVLDV